MNTLFGLDDAEEKNLNRTQWTPNLDSPKNSLNCACIVLENMSIKSRVIVSAAINTETPEPEFEFVCSYMNRRSYCTAAYCNVSDF